jgi:hypothetical protein
VIAHFDFGYIPHGGIVVPQAANFNQRGNVIEAARRRAAVLPQWNCKLWRTVKTPATLPPRFSQHRFSLPYGWFKPVLQLQRKGNS